MTYWLLVPALFGLTSAVLLLRYVKRNRVLEDQVAALRLLTAKHEVR